MDLMPCIASLPEDLNKERSSAAELPSDSSAIEGKFCRWWGAALSTPGQNVTPAAQFAEAGVIYVGLTLARIFVYILHVTGEDSMLAACGAFGRQERLK